MVIITSKYIHTPCTLSGTLAGSDRRFSGLHEQKLPKKSSLISDVMQHRLLVSYPRFRTTYRSHLQRSSNPRTRQLDSLNDRPIGFPETAALINLRCWTLEIQFVWRTSDFVQRPTTTRVISGKDYQIARDGGHAPPHHCFTYALRERVRSARKYRKAILIKYL